MTNGAFESNFVPRKEVKSQTNEPSNPQEGNWWFNPSNQDIKYYNGSDWITPGNDIGYIQEFMNDVAATQERHDLELSINSWNYDDGFIDIFWDESKISNKNNISLSNRIIKLQQLIVDYGWENEEKFGAIRQSNIVYDGNYAAKLGSGDGSKSYSWSNTEKPSQVQAALRIDSSDSSASATAQWRINGSVNLQLRIDPGDAGFEANLTDTGTNVNANQWYLVEFRNIDYVNEEADAYIDGTNVGTYSFVNSQLEEGIDETAIETAYSGHTGYYDVITILDGSAQNGSVTHTRKDFGFTPSKFVANPDFDSSGTGESVELEISDNSGNSVVLTESDFGSEYSVNFNDGNIQVSPQLTGDGSSSPEYYKTKVLGVQ